MTEDGRLSTDGGIGEARERLFHSLRQEIRDERVLQAMERVPREFFVPLSALPLAYDDIPLPIGEGQTISQPFIVALMTQSLELKGREKVLEVGTGSGYQAAILAELAHWVLTVERFPSLAEKAEATLSRLGYRNIEVHIAGKVLGWPPEAPYQAIIVTAGAPSVPDSLLEQLDIGGRMVIPVGARYEQDLLKISKLPGQVVTENLGPCRFVPLIADEAWEE